ncbi:hypothetical protein ACRALDRAFT_206817 [Sodiomyces alcalophilus JCM 7366]|uniref:uncharacterized protein n=1 Tax=Sodiomyces alcalophilus JCM 7366 TaxID=591952 RepID=UPI0039B58AFF
MNDRHADFNFFFMRNTQSPMGYQGMINDSMRGWDKQVCILILYPPVERGVWVARLIWIASLPAANCFDSSTPTSNLSVYAPHHPPEQVQDEPASHDDCESLIRNPCQSPSRTSSDVPSPVMSGNDCPTIMRYYGLFSYRHSRRCMVLGLNGSQYRKAKSLPVTSLIPPPASILQSFSPPNREYKTNPAVANLRCHKCAQKLSRRDWPRRTGLNVVQSVLLALFPDRRGPKHCIF